MGLKRPKISILRIIVTGAVGAVLFSIIAPNSVRAKHRVSSDQICRMNLQRLDAELYEYKQDHGRFPETLTPIYAKSNSQIDGCLEVMPDPIFGINEERYGADTYSSGYDCGPMYIWSCPKSGSHKTERLDAMGFYYGVSSVSGMMMTKSPPPSSKS